MTNIKCGDRLLFVTFGRVTYFDAENVRVQRASAWKGTFIQVRWEKAAHVYIKFFVKLNKIATETLEIIKIALGESIILGRLQVIFTQIKGWV